MRHEYRVTKFDPSLRARDGSYLRDDWTSIADVGRKFKGRVLTPRQYQRVEDRYLEAVRLFLMEAGVHRLRMISLELRDGRLRRHPLLKKKWLTLAEALKVARLMLRERLWVKLAAPYLAFVHFGHDYYMYIGTRRATPQAMKAVSSLGLFVEEFRSPYAGAS